MVKLLESQSKKVLSLLLCGVMLLSLASTGHARGADNKGWTSGVTTESDGTRVERSRIGDTQLESRSKGNRVVTTIRTGNSIEVVDVDLGSPFFTVTVNGRTKTYDRRDFIGSNETYKVPANPVELDRRLAPLSVQAPETSLTIASAVPPETWLRHPYSNLLIGTMSESNPIIQARAYESYSYFPTEFTSFAFSAWTMFSVAVGVSGLSPAALLTLVGPTAVINAALFIINAFTIDRNAFRRDWRRFVRITQDPNNGIWYWAGRTVWSELYISSTGVVLTRDISTNQHWDYNDVPRLMRTAIANYRRHHGLLH